MKKTSERLFDATGILLVALAVTGCLATIAAQLLIAARLL